MAEYPKNFVYSNQSLSWDPVASATEYEIVFHPAGEPVPDWKLAFKGPADSCYFNPPEGIYNVKGRSGGGSGGGIYGPEENVDVSSPAN